MDVLLNFISEDLIYAFGWTVMHSIWQGFLIAIIMALAFQILRKKSAKIRYEVASFSLFMVLVSAVSTFIWYFGTASEVIVQQVTLVGQNLGGEQISNTTILQSFRESCIVYFNNHLPMIVLIWMVGAGFFILRLFGGLAYVQRLKYRRIALLSPYWQSKVQHIASKIPNKKAVQIFESASIKVPMVIGHLKPYILLPIGAINQLDEKEVEAIIAHELGHVFRNDFLLNIMLSFIEVFFYYHPAVWWISGNIRLERENCCDDIAIKICGNSLIYAKALVRLQEINAYAPTFAMPFSGQKNQLLNRIKRILNQPQNRSNIMERLAATCFLLLAVVFMSVSPNHMKENVAVNNVIEIEEVAEFDKKEGVEVDGIFEFEVEEMQDTIPEGENVLRGKKLEITMKDGETVSVVLDGKVIPKEEYEDYDYIETEDGITVKGHDFPSIKGDDLIWPKVEEEEVAITSWYDTLSPDSQRNSGKIFRERLAVSKSQQSITKKKNEDGQTVIIIGMGGQEPVEILVDEQEDIIIVEGNELGDGDTAIIVEKNIYPSALRRYNLTNLDDSFFENKEGTSYFFLEDEKKRTIDGNNAELPERFEIIEEFLAEENDSELKILREKLERYTQEKDLMEKEQIKELKYHLLERAKRNEQSLMKKEERLKKRYDRLDRKSKEFREEQRLFFEKNKEVRFGLLGTRSSNEIAVKFASELKRDGLIENETDFSFSLSQKRMKVDGKKQAKAILKKYKALYQKLTGKEIKGKSNYQINFSSN